VRVATAVDSRAHSAVSAENDGESMSESYYQAGRKGTR
jgi:hypothetical protein